MNAGPEEKGSASSLPVSMQMENIRSEYFVKPREDRNGIEWAGRKIKDSVFEDLYIAQCEKESRKPDPEIRKHFIDVCINACEYVPQNCNNRCIIGGAGLV